HNALSNGDANMSGVRYNGTDLTGALKEAPIKNPKKAMIATQQGFKKKFDQTFCDSYGFANTCAFMVTKKTAKKCHLETVTDLAKHS
ncbi:glycine betaine ABC transporter substrate-binding protein, partial [Staphylococcus aureus]|uniref:glycine betaine ABC transporter substrate-binding protein n=1 Tax=Staphylococcus aureus TaxID=1280 RepID=UPI00278C66B6